jgi:hypothetical protein
MFERINVFVAHVVESIGVIALFALVISGLALAMSLHHRLYILALAIVGVILTLINVAVIHW